MNFAVEADFVAEEDEMGNEVAVVLLEEAVGAARLVGGKAELTEGEEDLAGAEVDLDLVVDLARRHAVEADNDVVVLHALLCSYHL